MILDKIENSKIYEGINEYFSKAFDFIKNANFETLELGTHEIDGENIFANIQEYETEAEDNCMLEGHQKYIDIQYMISGEEHIGITSYKGQKPINGGYKNDCAFFNEKTTSIKLETGKFAIFFPDDLHKPCIMINNPEKVKKVVLKVRVTDDMKKIQKALTDKALSQGIKN